MCLLTNVAITYEPTYVPTLPSRPIFWQFGVQKVKSGVHPVGVHLLTESHEWVCNGLWAC
jgi:hypothetical protein